MILNMMRVEHPSENLQLWLLKGANTCVMYHGLLELIFPFYALQLIYRIQLSNSCFPYTSLAEHHHIFCSLKRQL